jgi:hypothetical protein
VPHGAKSEYITDQVGDSLLVSRQGAGEQLSEVGKLLGWFNPRGSREGSTGREENGKTGTLPRGRVAEGYSPGGGGRCAPDLRVGWQTNTPTLIGWGEKVTPMPYVGWGAESPSPRVGGWGYPLVPGGEVTPGVGKMTPTFGTPQRAP